MGDDAAQVDKMMGLPMSQRQTNYKTVSPESGTRQCANCVFFKWSNWTGDYAPPVSSCHLVESYPFPILPTGICDRWEEAREEVYQPDPLQVVIVEDETKALELTPRPVSGLDRRLRKMRGKPVDGVQVVKTNEGRVAIIYTSNGYFDKDEEAVAQKALERYVERSWEEEAFVGDNVLLFWHMKGLGAVGDIVWAGMVEGFLCEVALERSTPVGSIIFDWLESGEEDTGASHGFYPTALRVEAGRVIYDEDIEKKETTVLPRQYAANGLTYSGVVKMADVKTNYLAKLLKSRGVDVPPDELGALLAKGPAEINARLAKAGVVPKERKEADTTSPDVQEADALTISLIEGMAALDEQLDKLQQTLTSQQSETASKEQMRQAETQTLQTVVKDLGELKQQFDAFLKQTPRRATDSDGTLLSEEQARQIKEQTAEYDPFFADLDVPKA